MEILSNVPSLLHSNLAFSNKLNGKKGICPPVILLTCALFQLTHSIASRYFSHSESTAISKSPSKYYTFFWSAFSFLATSKYESMWRDHSPARHGSVPGLLDCPARKLSVSAHPPAYPKDRDYRRSAPLPFECLVTAS